jgi:hypothetical protein
MFEELTELCSGKKEIAFVLKASFRQGVACYSEKE